MSQLGKILIVFGVSLVLLGFLLTGAGKIPLLNRFGRLPGDIIIHRGRLTLYFPWVTCLLVSLVFYVLFNIFRR
ncbi:MAG: DUF2905 domain-containing protein [Candidatus Neomarinimicrobiota bacterium]